MHIANFLRWSSSSIHKLNRSSGRGVMGVGVGMWLPAGWGRWRWRRSWPWRRRRGAAPQGVPRTWRRSSGSRSAAARRRSWAQPAIAASSAPRARSGSPPRPRARPLRGALPRLASSPWLSIYTPPAAEPALAWLVGLAAQLLLRLFPSPASAWLPLLLCFICQQSTRPLCLCPGISRLRDVGL